MYFHRDKNTFKHQKYMTYSVLQVSPLSLTKMLL